MRETQDAASRLAQDVERLKAGLPRKPPLVARPVLVIVSGLPGSGKSYFSRRLASQVPLLVLESDVLRKALSSNPSYDAQESARLFSACYALIGELLREGVPILLDATNLVESYRERLYQIAERMGAKVLLIYLKAHPRVVQQRLKRRLEGVDPKDNSEADWQVYQRMCDTVEPIKRDHFVIDTSGEIDGAISKIARHIIGSMRMKQAN